MRKLVISIITASLLIISFITSTFAFIVISVESGVDEFEFNIEGYDGLLISTDGINFKQDITSKKFKELIAGAEDDFDSLEFTGVTLKHNASKELVLDNNVAQFSKDTISNGSHSMIDATANIDYIVFDLWLKAEVSDKTHPNYILKMTDNTSIDSEDYTIKLNNSLSTIDKDYISGENLVVNPANSMRLGISNAGVFTTYECNAPSNRATDLGSSAIENGVGVNDPTKNAMYTYYNNIHPLHPFESAAEEDLEGFSNIEDSYTENAIDAFTYSNDGYNVIKLTVYIWLEGWDADYLATIPTSKINVNLEFELVKQ